MAARRSARLGASRHQGRNSSDFLVHEICSDVPASAPRRLLRRAEIFTLKLAKHTVELAIANFTTID